MGFSRYWKLGALAAAVAVMALAVVACRSSEEAAPAPAVDTDAITAAVAAAMAGQEDSGMSAEDMASAVQGAVDQAMSGMDTGMSADEMQAAMQAAVDSAVEEAMSSMDTGMSADEMQAAMQAAVDQAVEEAVAMAMPEETDMPTRGTEGQKFGGTVKYAVTDFGNFDPDLMGLSNGTRTYFHQVFDGIIVRGNSDELVTRLAESWEASGDLSEYTIKLRPNVKFHDGQAVTSRGHQVHHRPDAGP